jgi:hypothetical protein
MRLVSEQKRILNAFVDISTFYLIVSYRNGNMVYALECSSRKRKRKENLIQKEEKNKVEIKTRVLV